MQRIELGVMNKGKRTLCYKLFNKPGNLEEALEKARRNGNRAEIKIWSMNIDGIEHHNGRVKSGRLGSFYFNSFLSPVTGPKERYYKEYIHKALAIKRFLEKNGIEVDFIDDY